jgi:CheY-like chemotaxis protein
VEIGALLLQEAGYAVVSATDGKIAFEVARRQRLDAVVLDMMMPVVDGLGFLSRFEQEVGRPLPPVIACSGFDEYERLVYDCGARGFLRKPYSRDDLLTSLARLLAGVPIAAEVRDANRAGAARARAAAAGRRNDILTSAAVDLAAHEDARELVTWATGYFGAACASVSLLYRDGLHIIAAASSHPLGHTQCISEGDVLNPIGTFCMEVVNSATSLLLRNSLIHPIFRDRPIASRFPFYAGAPMVTADGVVLGTLVVADVVDHDFGAPDLALLGHLGSMLGKRIMTVGTGRAVSGRMFVAHGVFASKASDLLLDTELGRAERDGTALELLIMRMRDRTPSSLEALGAEILQRAGRRRAAVFEDAEGVAALLIGDGSTTLVKSRTDVVLGDPSLCERAAALGAVSFVGQKGAHVLVSELRRAARDALESWSTEGIDRRQLVRAPKRRAARVMTGPRAS